MSNQVKGKVIKILPEQNGIGKNGTWRKHEFVIETQDQYPKKICFAAWGDICSVVPNLDMGQEITVFYNPESREYNEKWYTELRAWKINTGEAQKSAPQQEAQKQESFPSDKPVTTEWSDKEDDDLPF